MLARLLRLSPPSWLAYAVAVLATTLALTVTLVTPALRAQGTPILLLVAITFSVAYGGLGPGLLATALSVVLAAYFLLPPYQSLSVDPVEVPRLVFFALAALLICYLNDAWRRSQRSELQARRHAEEARDRLRRLQTFTANLARAVTPSAVAETALREGLPLLDAGVGALARLSEGGDELELLGSLPLSPDAAPGCRLPLTAPSPLAEAVRSRRPVLLSRREWQTRFPQAVERPELAALSSRAVLPLLLDSEVYGVLSLGFDTPRAFDADDVAFMQSIAQQCALGLERARRFEAERRARDAAHVAAERADFLSEATRVLTSSLESEAVLASVTRLCVPRLADWCVVNLVDTRGRIEAVETAHADPTRAALLRQYIQAYPLQPHAASATGQALRTGQTVFYPRITPAELEAQHLDSRHLQFMQLVGYESAITVPLTGRDRCLGAMTLVRGGSDRLFTPADLATAEELAGRVAGALDNARLYAEAQALSRAREQLLHVVSHDLKNPLTAIRGFLHIMRRRLDALPADAAQPLRDPLARMDEASARMRAMIQDLVNAAVLDQAVALDLRATDLADLTRRVVAQHQAAAPQRAIAMHAAGPVVGLVDEDRLARVLDNLISNALKYTPQGGRIEVGVSRQVTADGPAAVIDVRDEGIGIPAADLPHIFQPFHRASNAQAIEGTGLGLASAQQIVQRHGGQMTVQSQEGQGATFSICLPLAQDN